MKDNDMQDQVGRFLESVQSERQFAENTVAAYRNDLTQFAHFIESPSSCEEGDVKCAPLGEWGDLKADHLNAYLRYLEQKDYASSTVARKAAAMKSFASWLQQEAVTSDDAGAEINTPKVAKYVPRAISPDEVERLMDEPIKDGNQRPDAARDHAMLEVLYATGMRVSELVALNVADVDQEHFSTLHVGEADRARTLPLSVRASDALAHYMQEARSHMVHGDVDALFVNHRGGRLTRQGFWLILKSYAERMGIGEMTPHTLRHSFAVHALRRGLDIKDVQRQLGHVSLSTTRVYWQLAQQPDSDWGQE